jgi:hypothetical protein
MSKLKFGASLTHIEKDNYPKWFVYKRMFNFEKQYMENLWVGYLLQINVDLWLILIININYWINYKG